MLRLLLSILILASGLSQAQYRAEVKDLSHQLKVFSGNRYINADSANGQFKALYLFIDAKNYKGNFLELESRKESTLFINGSLAKELNAGKIILKLDSMSATYSPALSFAFYSKPNLKLQAKIIAYTSADTSSLDVLRREQDHFLNFSIIAIGVLLFYFVLLFRVNPKLLADYFNFIKLFSFQEREENLLNTKILASGNLLIYGLISLAVSLLLLAVNYYSGSSWYILNLNKHSGSWILFYNWIRLSLFLFAMLISKSIVVYSFSRLFDFNEAAPIQFFNFIRLLLVICIIQGLLLTIYFIFEITSGRSYVSILYVMSVLLILWLPLVAFKLLRRSPFTTFHLFSYLCASEIFPVVIVIKLLFF